MISFLIQFKNERLSEILQAVSRQFYYPIDTIYLFIKPFLGNKMSVFEEYGGQLITN